MENFYELALKRRSIRKYEDTPVSNEDIEYFIKTAVTAPSGCNSQCWKFVAITNKNVIGQMAETVKDAIRAFCGVRPDNDEYKAYIEGKCRAATFFKDAPLVIAVFMTKLTYYDAKMTELYHEKGYTNEDMMRELSFPDVLSVGAAVQNLLLAVQEKGYGACWMNEPAVAGEKINQILDVSFEHKFMSLIPIGFPRYNARNKKTKELHEVFKLIK